MKQVMYLVVTFVVLFQLYATTSAAPSIQPPPPENKTQSTDTHDDNDDDHHHHHPHGDEHEFSVRVIETPGATVFSINNLLQEMSEYFHVDLNNKKAIVVLKEDQYGAKEQIYTEHVLTRKNQHRRQAHERRHEQTVSAPKMTTHLPASSSRLPIRYSDEETNETVRLSNGRRT